MALTEEDRELILLVFKEGPGALVEKAGMGAEEIRAFGEREEIQHALELMTAEMKHQDQLLARAQFSIRRRLVGMSDKALDVIDRALDPPEFARNMHGHVLNDTHGNPIRLDNSDVEMPQLKAAMDVLDRLGVKQSMDAGNPQDITVTLTLQEEKEEAQAKVLNIHEEGEKEDQKALARERVRNAIENLRKVVPEARAAVLEKLGGKSGAKGKVRKRPSKKSK